MGSTDYGSQQINVQFYAPVTSVVVNKRNLGVQPRGIYSGGYLTRVSDTSVTLSPLVCIIGDDDYQLRIETTTDVTITTSTTLKYIVLRWAYVASATNYMDVLAVAVGSIQSNDLIIGVCSYTGSTLTGFDYGDSAYPRNDAKTMDLFGRVEAEETPSLYVRVRAANCNYGDSNLKISNQRVGPFNSPTSNPRIDLVYIDTDGTVTISQGSEAATPAAPDYGAKVVLAEVRLGTGATTISQSMITDVRNWLGGSGGGGGGTSISDVFLLCGA